MSRINFSSFLELKTKQFYLRQLTADDATEIFYLRSDENVNKYLDRTRAKSLNDAEQFILTVNNSIKENKVLYWGIVPMDKDKLIGTICFWNFSDDYYSAEIGFELMPGYQGKGIMQEVLSEVINFGFHQLKLKTILGVVDPDNSRSVKILKKNNFVLKNNYNSDETDITGMAIYELRK